jgi:hypothetical protein
MIPAFIVYLLYISVLSFFVGKILFTNSKTFMMIIFNDREPLALATNRLFEIGFFLFSIGIGLWYMGIETHIANYKTLFEILSAKIGSFTIFMGVLLFGNLYLFFRGMKNRKRMELIKE